MRGSSPLSPTGRKLALIVLVFVSIVGCLLFLVHAEREILAGVRAYVGGEGVWSKRQKDAVLHLQRYAISHDEGDWDAYRAAITVPLGDRQARVELQKRTPDLTTVDEGFLRGGNHREDLAGMVMLFQRFGSVSYMADAIAIWTEADAGIDDLEAEAAAVRREIGTGQTTPASTAAFLTRIGEINRRLTPIEDAFSATLGAGDRQLEHVLGMVIYGAAALLVSLGVLLSWTMLRQVRRGEAALRASQARLEQEAWVSSALARLGQELIASVDAQAVYARLGAVTLEMLGARGTTTLLRSRAGGPYEQVAVQGDAAVETRLEDEAVAAAFAGSGAGDVVEMRRAGAPVQLALALRRGTDIVGVQLAQLAPGTRLGTEQRRIAQGIAHIGSMALANAQLLAEVERASQLKSEFVSTMSHELRTPLNVILGYAEIARDPESDLETADCIERIAAAGRDLLGLIETTLEVGRIDAGRDELRLETVPLVPFWTALGESCGRLPRRHTVTLDWGPPVQASATSDSRKLTVIVRNLVGNALKFTERGFVRTRVDFEGEELVLRVTDSGIGIRPEDHAAVFEMFRQADGSDTRRFGGSGLGLYIVRRFVGQLGGAIALESAPGHGSTFTIRLPREVTAASASRAA